MMPKEQYHEADVARKISDISFGVDSAANMYQQSHLNVLTYPLYLQDSNHSPVPYGVLDQRLGSNSKETPCQTCGKTINLCVGHFGYIDLELPVFHVGYFRSIISILQTICRRCSHVLLTEDEKYKFRIRLINKNISYMTKKNIRKKIIEKCKKVTKCPYCKETIGTVSKLTAGKGLTGNCTLKIVSEINRGRDKDAILKQHLDKIALAMKNNPDLDIELPINSVTQILTPINVMNIFERIPRNDIPLLAMNAQRTHPKDLILTRLLVPPISIRPSVISELKAGTNEDDLTSRQSEILFVNDVVKKNKVNGVTMSNYQLGWDYLTLQIALYINSELTGIPNDLAGSKPTRGLVQRLKGKQGRFRGNLSGKRADYTSRTVISPDPSLQIDQVGVPLAVAKTLTFPERVIPANIDKIRQLVINGPDIWPGANYLQQKGSAFKKFLKYGNREKLAQELKLGDIVERHLQDDDVVLFNRQPSLHKLSIMSHRAKIHQHRTFRFNVCVCNPYNADFDGDEMNLHLPQTVEAKAEAKFLLGNKFNLVTPRNGELLIAATQDFLTGAFLLSMKDTFFDYDRASYLAGSLLDDGDKDLHIDLPQPCILKPRQLWSGKQIISLIFRPNESCPVKANLEAKGKTYTRNREFCVNESYVIVYNSELIAGTLDKGHLGSGGKGNNIFYVLLRDYKIDDAIKSMWRLSKMASVFLMTRGFSIGIGDVTPPKKMVAQITQLLGNGYSKCIENIVQMNKGILATQPGCTIEETLESILLKELSIIRDQAGHICCKELPPTNSPLIMAESGSKGSVINIAQMVACVGQQALNGKRVPDGFEYRSLPHFEHHSRTPEAKGFVENSFYSGLTPTECFFHTMGGREGLVDTAVKTAETGYMQRRLVKSLEDLVVHYDNTVRNAEKDVVQFNYGCDDLDPTFMEGKDRPVDFLRVLRHVQARYPYRNEEPLTQEQIKRATKSFLEMETFNNCSDDFKEELRIFMDKQADTVERVRKRFADVKVVQEIARLTVSQVVCFLNMCCQKYIKSIIEPGTAVGALAAQSIGEPGTQMTLKTFHFAGVASMNITQGVPRIKEIINASKTISTPVIRAQLANPHDMESAMEVKARLERKTLRDIAWAIDEVYDTDGYLQIHLDLKEIKKQRLEVNAESVHYSICKSKLKLKPTEVIIENESVLSIYPVNSQRNDGKYHLLKEVKAKLPDVIVKGLPTVNRAVITSEEKCGQTSHSLCVEGDNLREVIATYGIDGNHTVSNNVMEVYNTLGIEAARETIMKEITMVMENHGMSVDYRHIMLLAAQMTHTGEVLGYTRHGLSKMKQSVLNLASFEKTADHLFDAAYYGQTDKINGVSENIIMGMPAPIGTGIFKLVHKPRDDVELHPKMEEILFEEALLPEVLHEEKV